MFRVKKEDAIQNALGMSVVCSVCVCAGGWVCVCVCLCARVCDHTTFALCPTALISSLCLPLVRRPTKGPKSRIGFCIVRETNVSVRFSVTICVQPCATGDVKPHNCE
jgi:hypothetical protein